MKSTKAALIMSLVLVSAYAEEYDKNTQEALSAPTEHYVATVHIDGNASIEGDANHPPEAIPATEPPKGGGISVTKGDQGKWRMRVFQFIPSQIISPVGKEVTVHFVGVQGPSHRIKVDGVEEEIQLKRGEIKTVTLHPTEKGAINFRSLDHQPSMSGQIIVIAENFPTGTICAKEFPGCLRMSSGNGHETLLRKFHPRALASTCQSMILTLGEGVGQFNIAATIMKEVARWLDQTPNRQTVF